MRVQYITDPPRRIDARNRGSHSRPQKASLDKGKLSGEVFRNLHIKYLFQIGVSELRISRNSAA